MRTHSAKMRDLVRLITLLSFFLACLAFARSSSEWGAGKLQDEQKGYRRVRNARTNRGAAVDSIFEANGIEYPAKTMIRVFKLERILELWAFSERDSKFVKIRAYPMTAFSGHLGPKRRQGDLQIPEGFYSIVLFNPVSSYHLSMKIDYPNASDRILGDPNRPGGEIFIHGSNVTIGCIPIGDDSIEELYIIALDSKSSGYEIPVHIFPCNLADTSCGEILRNFAENDTTLSSFWGNLETGHDIFDTTCVPVEISVNNGGKYLFSD